MSPLKEIVDGIHGQVAKIEDDLKVFIFFTIVAHNLFVLFLVSLVLNHSLMTVLSRLAFVIVANC